MKLRLNHILIIIILLLVGVGFFGYNHLKSEIEERDTNLKGLRIKNDSLRFTVEGQARKLVADTLTIRELNRKVDSLGIELEGRPTSATVINVQPRDTIKVTDTITVNEGQAYISDYYPSRDNYFLHYTNNFSLDDLTGNSQFRWNDIDIDLVISENEDGTFEANMNAPDFVVINSLDVQALPMETQKRDNFGILLGGGYGTDFASGTNYLEVGGGIRINKFYIEIEGNTNQQADIGVKFEF